MLKIKDIYNKLGYDKEAVFQIKNKITFNKIIKELIPIFKRDRFSDNYCFLEDCINYKNAYFILGAWRNGMFKLRVGRKHDTDHEIYILADTKENPMSNAKHVEQIEDIINILDKYRKFVIKKRLMFDDEFDLVDKIEEVSNEKI